MEPVDTMKVLVCGGRDYQDREAIRRVLDKQHHVIAFTHLIHGTCIGVDQIAAKWAEDNGVQSVGCPAQWWKYGKAGGPIRNRRMLELQPDLLIAFPGGRGTANMVSQAKEANVQVYCPIATVSASRDQEQT